MRKLLPILGLASVVIFGPQVPSATAGGNWFEFGRADSDLRKNQSRWDIFATGERAVANVGYLRGWVGAEDGPFHLWIERGRPLEEGKPIPESAIQVGTFEMAADGLSGHAIFVLPALPSGMYSLTVCDNPCTTTGFGEYVQGWLTIVQTPAEGQLLTRIHELKESFRGRSHLLKADLHRAERREQRLKDRLETVGDELEATRAQVDQLVSSASSRSGSASERALIDGAAGAWIASGLLVIAALIIRTRRGPRIIVPDTPAELLSTEQRPVPSTRR